MLKVDCLMAHTSETRFGSAMPKPTRWALCITRTIFVWMEMGRTDYCKTVGFSYRDMETDDANMAVAERPADTSLRHDTTMRSWCARSSRN